MKISVQILCLSLLWVTLVGRLSAADYYVATNAVPASPYNVWSKAFTNVQDALNVARANDTIYLAGHVFGITNQLSWTGLAYAVTIRGGYVATNETNLPGSNNPALWPTVIVRTSGTNGIWMLNGVTNGTLAQVTIAGGSNTYSGQTYGGGLYLTNCFGQTISSCVISGNVARSTLNHGYAFGGGICLAKSSVVLTNCVVLQNKAISEGNFTSDAGLGGGLFVAGSATATVRDCVFTLNDANNNLYRYGQGGGIYAAGTVVLKNCLLFANRSYTVGDGLYVTSGITRVENCTVASHADDGIYRGSGSFSVSNSIIWDNGDDIVGTGTLAYCCIQDGDSNGVNGCISSNPRFEYGYYLPADSPCTNAGSMSAIDAGLSAYTTLTNGQVDGDTVDLGYHYAGAFDPTYLDLYVAPAPTGSDGYVGTDPLFPLATIGKAIAKARDGSRIHIASGAYTNGAESFPLILLGKVGVQLLGTNRETTVVSASGSNQRVFTLVGAPLSRIEGLSVRGGKFAVAGTSYGGGVYVDSCGGTILASCTVISNRVEPSLWHAQGYGGGLACIGGSLLVSNCQFSYNAASGYGDSATDFGRGGGVYAGGEVTIRDTVFNMNDAVYDNLSNVRSGEGGGVYGNGPVVLKNCLFYGNRAFAAGDGICVGGGTSRVENCTVANHADDGIYRSGGVLSVSNSIVWENGDDITGVVSLAYSCIQDGDSNGVNGCINTDPLFEYGYYLGANSLCVNTGSMSAVAAGLSAYTTRADGQTDSGTVDLGYHYSAGADLGYADLYVAPAPTGSDGYVGTNPLLPLATITKALSLARDGSRIHLSTGAYTNGPETFPLRLIGKGGVQLLGTNREATVINAARSGQRVLLVSNAPNTRVEGVTITGGTATNSTVTSCGGGIYIDNSSGSMVLSSVISSNKAESISPANHVMGYGGGVYCGSGSLILSNCVISSNAAISRGDWATDPGCGGGIYAAGIVTLQRCVLFQNVATNGSNPYGEGGGVYGMGTVLLRNCLLYGNRARSAADAIMVRGGQMNLENCTVANHPRDGIWRTNGTVAVTNSIVWNNGDDIVGPMTLGYSDIEDGDNNTTNGCFSVNPQFADTTNFHLLSKAGYYGGGYFSGGSWSTNTAVSNNPCIDMGNLASPWSAEPAPNGRRVNLGAYGNTEVASQTFLEEPGTFTNLTVHAYPLAIADLGPDWAILKGEVLHTGGGANPQAYICWATSDKGTSGTDQWTHVESMGARAQWEPFSNNLSGLAQIAYCFRCYVTNDVGEDWSAPVVFGILVPAVTNTGASPVRRRSARLNGQILDVGGSTPSAWFHYWKTGDSVTNVVVMNSQTGTFSALLSPLPVNTSYSYRILASNSSGSVWSDIKTFATWSDPTGWYVATNGSGAGGTNWATAFTNIQDAMDEVAPSDTVYLAAQRFAVGRQIELTNRTDVSVRGGYAGVGTPGSFSADPTVITRLVSIDSFRLWYISGVTNSTLDRLTVMGASNAQYLATVYGGGFMVTNSSNLTLASCNLLSNRVESANWHSYSYGGGLCCMAGSSVLLTNCVLSYNQAFGCGDFGVGYNPGDNGYGGAICALGDVTLQDCRLFMNEVDTITASRDAGRGGAVYSSGLLSMRNCLLYQNRSLAPVSGWGDAVYVGGGTSSFQNCTITSHSDDGICRAAGLVSVSNSVVWENGDDITGVVSLAYSTIQDGDSNGVNYCISADPMFEMGYYLGTNSLCVNAGSMSAVAAGLANYTTRTDGQADDGTVDLGYHYTAGLDTTYADLYVTPAPVGNDVNVGTNPALPLATITKAIATALDGTRIHLSAGSYTNGVETFPLTIQGKSGVQLLGTNKSLTVINAWGSNQRVLVLNNAPFARIEGVTLTGGKLLTGSNNSYGGGVYIENCSGVTLASCQIVSNRTEVTGSTVHYLGAGGGVYCANGSLTLSNCVVATNIALCGGDQPGDSGRGGGIYAAGLVTLLNCAIFKNEAGNTMQQLGQGGGLFASGTLLMRNCLVYTNRAYSQGDALYVGGGSAVLENCTVANHGRDGIWRTNGTVAVTNSIVWNNGDDIVGSVTLGYSDIEDGDSNGVNGCVNGNPKFVNAAIGDFKLGVGSAAINLGLKQDWMTTASIDLAGNPRLVGSTVDMGAYESSSGLGTIFTLY